jgi:hypothetical protein
MPKTRSELIEEKYGTLLESLQDFECLKEKKSLFPSKNDYSPEFIYNYFKYNLFEISIYSYVKKILDDEKIPYSKEELQQIYFLNYEFVKFLKEL